jgi:hypothetical protein
MKINPTDRWQQSKVTKNQKALFDIPWIEKMYYVTAVNSSEIVK